MKIKTVLKWIKNNIIYTTLILIIIAALPLAAYSYNSSKYNKLITLAQEALKDGRFDDSVKLYNDALRYGSKYRHKITEAFEMIDRERDSKNVLEAALIYLKDKKYLEAVSEFKKIEASSQYFTTASEKALEAGKAYINENLEKARTDAANKKYSEAVVYLDNILKFEQENKEAAELKKHYNEESTKLLAEEEAARKKAEKEKLAAAAAPAPVNTSVSANSSGSSNAAKTTTTSKNTTSSSPVLVYGNVINQGLAAFDGEYVFYSRPGDGYKLYKERLGGAGLTKVSDFSGVGLSVVGDWVYFSDPMGLAPGSEKGIFKIKKDGSGKTRITGDRPTYISVVGEWIYYIVQPGQGSEGIYKIKTDGTGRTNISIAGGNYIIGDNPELVVAGDWIYCNLISKGEGATMLVRVKADGSAVNKLSNASQYFAISNDWIYYKSSNHKEIWKMRVDGTGKSLVHKVDNHAIYSINVSGNSIYYTADNQAAELQYAGVYKLNIDGTGLSRLYNNYSRRICITLDWLYFEAPGSGTKRMKTDGSQLSGL